MAYSLEFVTELGNYFIFPEKESGGRAPSKAFANALKANPSEQTRLGNGFHAQGSELSDAGHSAGAAAPRGSATANSGE